MPSLVDIAGNYGAWNDLFKYNADANYDTTDHFRHFDDDDDVGVGVGIACHDAVVDGDDRLAGIGYE